MKTTPFTHFHEALGARMAPFAGYNMPIEYSGIKDEHLTVREKLGVFDVSHMGEFWIKGPKAFELVQKYNIPVSLTIRVALSTICWFIVSVLKNICWW